VFRIKRDPAKLLGRAVARSTQTFGGYALWRTDPGESAKADESAMTGI